MTCAYCGRVEPFGDEEVCIGCGSEFFSDGLACDYCANASSEHHDKFGSICKVCLVEMSSASLRHQPMKCGYCGTVETVDEMEFCVICGNDFNSQVIVCGNCATVISRQAEHCYSCGLNTRQWLSPQPQVQPSLESLAEIVAEKEAAVQNAKIEEAKLRHEGLLLAAKTNQVSQTLPSPRKPLLDYFIYWLRWLGVLPGGLIAGFLALFPLAWLLRNSLSSIVEPYPEGIERGLSPAVLAAAFIWYGASIAPNYKTETAVVLFGLWLFITGGFVFLAVTGGQWMGGSIYLPGNGIPVALSCLAAFLSTYYVRKKYDGNLEPSQN